MPKPTIKKGLKKKPLTFSIHKERWKNCQKCSLCENRKQVVFTRGTIPCDLLLIGEAPGMCISGDTLIETAYRDISKYPQGIPIRDLVGKKNFKVYSYDTESRRLKLGLVKKVWKTGIKKLYEVSFFWWGAPPNGKGGRQKYTGSIKVTENHPFLLKTGEYRSIRQGLTTGNRLQPFYRRGKEYSLVGVSSASMKLEHQILIEDKLGRGLEENEQVHHIDRNKLNNRKNNLEVLDIADHARVHGLEDNPMFNEIHRETHRVVMNSSSYKEAMSQKMKEVLKDPEVYAARRKQILDTNEARSNTVKERFKDPDYYWRYLVGQNKNWGYPTEVIQEKFSNKFPDVTCPDLDNHQITSIKYLGLAPVYDMEVAGYHNFAANGIIIHNSEDVLGRPFVGPAGKLLDRMIEQAMEDINEKVTIAFTNLVGCIPMGDDGSKTGEPDEESIEACLPKVYEFVRLARPRGIMLVGKLPTEWLEVEKLEPYLKKEPHYPKMIRSIVHPAAILRADVTQQGLMVQRTIVELNDLITDIVVPF